MILLHPDMAPDPAPDTTSVKRTTVPATAQKSPHFRLPSARTLARFLGQAQAAVRLRGQVTVLLTTDAAIRRLNRQFRGKNKATDVLSFPAGIHVDRLEDLGAVEPIGPAQRAPHFGLEQEVLLLPVALEDSSRRSHFGERWRALIGARPIHGAAGAPLPAECEADRKS